MITRDDVLKMMRDIVYHEGADRTAVCYYSNVNEDEFACATAPECIVGQWLFRQGVRITELGYLDVENVGDFARVVLGRDALPFTLPSATDEAYATLLLMQRVQDSHGTWGEALKFAETLKFSSTTGVPGLTEFENMITGADAVLERIKRAYTFAVVA